MLSEIEVGEVWGIGRKLAPKLNQLGIHTVLDLKKADSETLRSKFSVVMEKTIRELNGTVCIELEDVAPPKKQILSSRSFGVPVREMEGLAESITLYMTRAAEKLRRQQCFAGSVYVYIRTSPFKPDDPFYANNMTIPLPAPTDDTRKLVGIALWALRRMYRPGYNYAKAGVMLSEIVPAEGAQTDLFASSQQPMRSDKLMATMDSINRIMGRQTVKLAAEGYNQPWKMKQGNRRPGYTTRWEGLPVIVS